jgi:hypothetical protein
VSGRIENLSGACPVLRFDVAASTFVTDRHTDFKKMHCHDVREGVAVRATGSTLPHGTVSADRIERASP